MARTSSLTGIAMSQLQKGYLHASVITLGLSHVNYPARGLTVLYMSTNISGGGRTFLICAGYGEVLIASRGQ